MSQSAHVSVGAHSMITFTSTATFFLAEVPEPSLSAASSVDPDALWDDDLCLIGVSKVKVAFTNRSGSFGLDLDRSRDVVPLFSSTPGDPKSLGGVKISHAFCTTGSGVRGPAMATQWDGTRSKPEGFADCESPNPSQTFRVLTAAYSLACRILCTSELSARSAALAFCIASLASS